MADSPPAKRYYRPELDALRFFAFLCVFGFHRIGLVGPKLLRYLGRIGAFGVPMFFLLSAFLITELLLRERELTGEVHIAAFYVRRILRIWPLYFAAFWGFWWLGHYLANVGPKAGAWVPFTFFMGNWFILRHGWMAGPVDPLWSISVEEQFYLCIPALAHFGGRRALAVVSGILLLISYAIIVHFAAHRGVVEIALWCNSFFQFQFFAGGMLMAVLLHGRRIRLSPLLRLTVAIGGATAWLTAPGRFFACAYVAGDPQPSVAQAITGWGLVLLGAVLFLVAVLDMPSGIVPGWLSYLGKISYGLYIFHSFFIYLICNLWRDALMHTGSALGLGKAAVNAVMTVLVLASTIGMSALSYWGFESPFLRLKERFTFVQSRPVGASAANG